MFSVYIVMIKYLKLLLSLDNLSLRIMRNKLRYELNFDPASKIVVDLWTQFKNKMEASAHELVATISFSLYWWSNSKIVCDTWSDLRNEINTNRHERLSPKSFSLYCINILILWHKLNNQKQMSKSIHKVLVYIVDQIRELLETQTGLKNELKESRPEPLPSKNFRLYSINILDFVYELKCQNWKDRNFRIFRIFTDVYMDRFN